MSEFIVNISAPFNFKNFLYKSAKINKSSAIVFLLDDLFCSYPILQHTLPLILQYSFLLFLRYVAFSLFVLFFIHFTRFYIFHSLVFCILGKPSTDHYEVMLSIFSIPFNHITVPSSQE